MAINTSAIINHLQVRTGCSIRTATSKTQQYFRLCAQQVTQHLNKSTDDNVYVSAKQMRDALGRAQRRGQADIYYWDLIQSMPERALTILDTGDNLRGRITMAKLNYEYTDILKAAGNPVEIVEELYKDMGDADCDNIPIDMASLAAYIESNRTNIARSGSNQALIKTLNENLIHAQQILTIAEAFGGFMPHAIKESVFGRKYYTGPNLQTTPKIVRMAALGDCYEYDIEASVFSWKLNAFKRLVGEELGDVPSCPETLEYLDHKVAIRRRLAQVVFDTDADWAIKKIKEAMSAIGFGAPLRMAGYVRNGTYEPTALNSIITNHKRLCKFIEDPWIIEFCEEQATMNSVIIGIMTLRGQRDIWKTIPELWTNNHRLKPNSVISYLYQHSEREILEYMVTQAQEGEVLLTVHDCIYTRRPIDLREMRAGLAEFGDYYRLDVEQWRAYKFDGEVQEHRQRIQEEERRAAEKFGTSVHKASSRRVYREEPEQRQDCWLGGCQFEPLPHEED